MNNIRRIYQYVKPYRRRFLLAIICMILHAFLTVFFVRVFQELLEAIISDISVEEGGLVTLSIIATGLLLIYFFKGIIYYGQKYLSKYVSHKVMRDLRNDLYTHLQNLSLSFYNASKTGEIISRVTNDVKVLEDAIVKSTVSLIYETLTVIGGFIYLLYLNYRLTIFLLIIFPLIILIVVNLNKKIRNKSREVQMKIADVSDILQETLAAIRVVKSFGREEYEQKRFSRENQANFEATVKNSQYKAALSPLVEFSSALGFTLVLWFGGLEVMRGTMRPAELIAFFTMLITLSNPLRSVAKINATIQTALAAADRVFETLDRSQIIKSPVEAVELEKIRGRVTFDNVSFAYDEELVLSEINLDVRPGEAVALVGPSGAGKSTLVDLIPRFYDPTKGRIMIDDHDIRKVELNSLRGQIGIVPQETILFSGTIQDNISYGNLEAGEDDIRAAARSSNSHDFIQELPEGYQTEIGERGVGLSGGQQQRIAIARAVLKDPAILIFDEATSSLDTRSEELVQEALKNLMEDRTTFIIAHRLNTVINANRIIVLQQGRIVESGNHENLINQEGIYSRLFRRQFVEDAQDSELS